MDEKAAVTLASGSFRGRSAVIACVLIGAAVFASFLIADFPYGETLTSILAPYQLKLTYQSQRISPPIGAELTDVTLFSTAGPDDQTLLQSPAVTLAPTLAALLLGRRGIRVSADLYGGTVQVTLYQHADNVDLNFTLDSLKLAESEPLKQIGAVFDGNLSGSGTAHMNGPRIPDASGMMAVAGDNLAISIVRGFPAIHLGTLTGNLELEQGAIKLTDIIVHGPDLDLKGSGTIQLGDNPDDSTIDATFYLVPTQNGRDHFGFFLRLLPHPPGPDAPYTLQGDLRAPSIS